MPMRPEARAEYQRRWRAKNPDYARLRREQNPDYHANWMRERRATHPEFAARQREAHSRISRERREWLNKLKIERGCADCGYKGHPAALDFDHRPGMTKVANIAMLYISKMETLLDEIAKCDLVCANCHRVRTWVTRKKGVVAV